ncbi:MAG: putative lipid II flippase FtsW [Dermatophilaceae bacterium]
MSSTAAPARAASSPSRTGSWLVRLESPVTTYYLILGVTGLLVVFGLVMVLSASSVVSIGETSSAYSIFVSQLGFAAIGTLALMVASRVPVRAWRVLALPALVLAVVLQLVVVYTPVGVTINGNRNWLDLKVFTLQPSELVKVALVLTGGVILAAKRRHLTSLPHVLVPYLVPLAAGGIGAVLLGHDVGTALVLVAIVAGVLFAAGVPLRFFAYLGVPAVAAVVALVVTSPNRLGRLDVWLGRDDDIYGAARQPIHGRFALADGGWFGVGLGQSREKWGLLSEPHNDFIFAIIGEELGLPGTVAVLVLLGLLAFACLRLATRTDDLFVRVVTAGVMTWVLVQAMVNIGAVVNLLPVIGVPLPLVSSGGSSLITTMAALGILLSFARREPGCAQALSARSSALRRSLAVLPATVRSRTGRRR